MMAQLEAISLVGWASGHRRHLDSCTYICPLESSPSPQTHPEDSTAYHQTGPYMSQRADIIQCQKRGT